ncbi:MAG: Hsp20/alpha crystallin family protein [Alphaproteobacteria bacterium]|nr:Hsp20/alpha crystallin family protein [Alphaproteobacteria bacterium]
MALPSILPPFWRDPKTNDNGFERLQKEVDRVFENFSRGFPVPVMGGEGAFALGRFAPKVDITETDNQMEVAIELPGVTQDDIAVSLTDDVLTIKGEKKSETEDKKKDYHLVERSYGMFQRMIRLPFDPGNAEPHAEMRDGILRITIAKPPEAASKTRRVEIKSAG